MYEYQSSLFPTRLTWLRAVCQGWLAAGGLNNAGEILDTLDTMSCGELATECFSAWFSEDGQNEHDVTVDELTGIFRELEIDRDWLK